VVDVERQRREPRREGERPRPRAQPGEARRHARQRAPVERVGARAAPHPVLGEAQPPERVCAGEPERVAPRRARRA